VFSLSLSLGRLVSLLIVVVGVVREDLLAHLVRSEDGGFAVEDIDLFERKPLGFGNEKEGEEEAED